MNTQLPNGWHVEYNPKPIPDRRFDWDFWHDDNDIDNGLCGTAASKKDAIEQINEVECVPELFEGTREALNNLTIKRD
jgi:hypothetical protein